MAKQTYTVVEVPGSKRSSERPYSHAVIGRRSGKISAITAEAHHKATAAQTKRWDTKSWNDWKRASEATVGQLYRNHNNVMVVARDYEVEIGQKFMAENPTLEGYLEKLEASRAKHIADLKASPDGELCVLQWSMSHKNAFKALGTFAKHHIDLQVVPCVVVAKKSKLAA
ncbi:hypothetical protein [Piscinibacter gummiphilus]|uniref:Uncharacterized protein n=1 Tax=Piscinibacter gummiphilus TaxID=946333 RepID=A0ABZ0CNF2_9BURK|nr:hypothetical protein [Piscinibacter gummiphilus]WOB06514.1 hypothetical protein RXV79_16450 [Piscinibacter gummiphilus]